MMDFQTESIFKKRLQPKVHIRSAYVERCPDFLSLLRTEVCPRANVVPVRVRPVWTIVDLIHLDPIRIRYQEHQERVSCLQRTGDIAWPQVHWVRRRNFAAQCRLD